MLPLVTLVLLVLLGWSVLSVVAVLLLGVGLRRASDARTSPARLRSQAIVRRTARLLVLPSLIASTARDQRRQRKHG